MERMAKPQDRERIELRWQKIAALRREGATNLQIAEQLGWGAKDARVGAEVARMRAAGWKVDDRRSATPQEMRIRKAAMALMWEDDYTAAEIAEELEISLGACNSMLNRMRQAGEIAPRRERTTHKAPLREAVATLAAEDLSYEQIASRTKQSTSSVAGRIAELRRLERGRQQAVRVPRRVGDGRAQARHERVRKLAANGVPAGQIASQTGYTIGSVKTILSASR